MYRLMIKDKIDYFLCFFLLSWRFRSFGWKDLYVPYPAIFTLYPAYNRADRSNLVLRDSASYAPPNIRNIAWSVMKLCNELCLYYQSEKTEKKSSGNWTHNLIFVAYDCKRDGCGFDFQSGESNIQYCLSDNKANVTMLSSTTQHAIFKEFIGKWETEV